MTHRQWLVRTRKEKELADKWSVVAIIIGMSSLLLAIVAFL